jgi:hypothetical protein
MRKANRPVIAPPNTSNMKAVFGSRHLRAILGKKAHRPQIRSARDEYTTHCFNELSLRSVIEPAEASAATAAGSG